MFHLKIYTKWFEDAKEGRYHNGGEASVQEEKGCREEDKICTWEDAKD